jgi:cytochrome c oxidase subunit 4
MTPAERRLAWRHLRKPAGSLVLLMALLAANIALGVILPFPGAWIAELGVLACMVLTVLLVSMEMIEEPPLVRVFSALGFFWVMIMFGMTLTDYLYR